MHLTSPACSPRPPSAHNSLLHLHLHLLLLLSALALAPPPTSAHGYVTNPPARHDGPALRAACGAAVAEDIRRDNTSHVDGLPELAAAAADGYDPARCNLWLCRGLQFADNADNVQVWHPGQVVNVRVRLAIPHDGRANVSLVETARNRIVSARNNSDSVGGEPLVVWPSGYANETLFYGRALPKNNTDFNVTLPDVGDTCSKPGACVGFLPLLPPLLLMIDFIGSSSTFPSPSLTR